MDEEEGRFWGDGGAGFHDLISRQRVESLCTAHRFCKLNGLVGMRRRCCMILSRFWADMKKHGLQLEMLLTIREVFIVPLT